MGLLNRWDEYVKWCDANADFADVNLKISDIIFINAEISRLLSESHEGFMMYLLRTVMPSAEKAR
jgi:hypothetical protein